MTGLRDYVNKNRFPGVVMGLSGGIDSAFALRSPSMRSARIGFTAFCCPIVTLRTSRCPTRGLRRRPGRALRYSVDRTGC